MRNSKFKRTLGLFIWMFIILFVFSTSFTWINYYQFKSNSEKNELEQSQLIASDIKNRYESVSTFINSMDPFISETIEKSLYSIERELKANSMQIDNKVLESLQQQYNLTNIYVLDENGIVTYATDQREIGKYSREFYSEKDKQKWEEAFKRIVKTKEVYIEDKFYRSEMNPYRYHKWGYKGIGNIDGIGLVVLEVGIQVMDIKDKSISPLVQQVVDLDKISDNITNLEFVNLPPTKLHADYKEGQTIKDGKIITKVNVKGLDGSDVQVVITTQFSPTQNGIDLAFNNASIWTAFYVIFSFLICLLFYYRFAVPTQYTSCEALERSIRTLEELKEEIKNTL